MPHTGPHRELARILHHCIEIKDKIRAINALEMAIQAISSMLQDLHGDPRAPHANRRIKPLASLAVWRAISAFALCASA